jgi:hypothetical protein
MSGPSTRQPRRGEGFLWWTTTTVSCALGIILGGLELGTGSLAICWAFSTFLTLCCLLSACGPRIPRGTLVRHTVLGGVIGTGCLGLAVGLGVAGLVWILAVAATSRAARVRARAWLVEKRSRDTADVPPAPEPPVARPVDMPEPAAATLRDLDDEALCLAWRRSYVQLQQSTSASARIRHVQQRERLLDELERRDPAGLAAWLASGCRAAGNPLPYLVRPTTSEATGRGGDEGGPETDGDEGSGRTQ